MIESVIEQLVKDAQASFHRRVLVLAGGGGWGRAAVAQGLATVAFEEVLWIAEDAPVGATVLPAHKATQLLGRDLDAVVFDIHSGCHVDALGAVAGTIRGGGLLILLTPPLDELWQFDDPEHERITVAPYARQDVTGRFLQRLARTIKYADGLVVVSPREDEGDGLHISGLDYRGPAVAAEPMAAGELCRTPEQSDAVAAVVKVATGHRRRPLVLTSDRGRGKSAALGIAAAQLILDGRQHIIVTAPQLASVEGVFEHARALLPDAIVSRGSIHTGAGVIEFVAPDDLVAQPRDACLVMVDEAAAIPVPMLTQLLEQSARIVFATTVHGYEGTGQGFAVRFHNVLSSKTPGWRALTLETPIRWAAADPLEAFIFRALLLNASAVVEGQIAEATLEACVIERLDRDCLEASEPMLAELFGLLVLAHYRTRPFDLRLLLDGPNVDIYTMRYQGHVVGAALVALEGGFDEATAAAIYENRRRPQGNLIPQTLSAHLGLEQAASLRYARLMRIAIHPALQRRGFGSALLQAIAGQLGSAVDCLGSSFGVTPELLHFWHRAGFVPVRLGLTREQTSGTHSVVMLRPQTVEGETLLLSARDRFLRTLPHLLAEPLAGLDAALVAALSVRPELELERMDAQDWADLVAFGFGQRGYEMSSPALWRLVVSALSDPALPEMLSDTKRDALIIKVLQRRSWLDTASSLGLSGRAAVLELLRNAVRTLVAFYGDDWVMSEAERFTRA